MSHDQRRVKRIVEKAEFVEECLAILAEKQSVSRSAYHDRPELRDIVERRFEKTTHTDYCSRFPGRPHIIVRSIR